jgi:hypothetical protein
LKNQNHSTTRYALRRPILGVSRPIPVVAVDGDGVGRRESP